MGRCLDLLLSSGRHDVVSVSAAAPLVAPDALHLPLAVEVRLTPAPSVPDCEPNLHDGDNNAHQRSVKWNFNKAHFPLLYATIAAIDWSPLSNLDLENSLLFFYKTLTDIFDEYVPKKKRTKATPKYVYPEWFTPEIIRELALKAKLHKRFKASRLDSDYESFARCRARVKTCIRKAEEQHRDRVQNHLIKDPKAFWNNIKSKRNNFKGWYKIRQF
jgi:hypothetical protein